MSKKIVTKFYASRMEGIAYGNQGEHSIQLFESLSDALDHAVADNFYDPDQNEIRAGYVAVVLCDQNGTQLESDHLPVWSAEDALVATGEVSKLGALRGFRKIIYDDLQDARSRASDDEQEIADGGKHQPRYSAVEVLYSVWQSVNALISRSYCKADI